MGVMELVRYGGFSMQSGTVSVSLTFPGSSGLFHLTSFTGLLNMEEIEPLAAER